MQIATPGVLISKWMDGHFIISGDLVYAFRQRQKQRSAMHLQVEADGHQVFLCRQDVCRPSILTTAGMSQLYEYYYRSTHYITFCTFLPTRLFSCNSRKKASEIHLHAQRDT